MFNDPENVVALEVSSDFIKLILSLGWQKEKHYRNCFLGITKKRTTLFGCADNSLNSCTNFHMTDVVDCLSRLRYWHTTRPI